jgi:hypothetical protein
MHRLAALDAELMVMVRGALDNDLRQQLERDASDELRPFRERMTDAAYARAREAAIDRLVRERFKLPTLEPSV